ncbi:MAG TPA: Spy/CpxP family protein refolding chaperone [Armatimonadota bacterium]|nr:Spy/CpxP family protein refolding chaperone [Armatimonadota bacterium]
MKFRIGPGTVITLIAALLIGGYSVYKHRVEASRPPIVERHVDSSSISGIAPAPEFALRHEAELHLTPAQATKIKHIATQYRAEVTPYKAQLDKLTEEFHKNMERAAQSKRPEDHKVTVRGSALQRLNSIVATTRHAYWQQVVNVLTKPQQQTMKNLIGKVTIADLQ